MEMSSLSAPNIKPQNRPLARRVSGHDKNKRNSKTYSSSEDDLHSDENLRPYETVKTYQDKKLNGMGKWKHGFTSL